MNERLSLVSALAVATLAMLAGCTIHPQGESAERQAALRAGEPYRQRLEDRAAPPLPDHPSPDDLVRYALLTNGNVEQKYWEWRSAIEQIPQDGTPGTTLAINAATNLTRGQFAWSKINVTAQNMPSMMIPWPGKLGTAARRALDNARAAGDRFRKAQFELRAKVLDACDDYSLNVELIRLEQANGELLQLMELSEEARSRAGAASQGELLATHNQLDLSRNDIARLRAKLSVQRAVINQLLNRDALSALAVPTHSLTPQTIGYSDEQVISMAAERNPELAALAAEIRAGHEGIRLARLQYFPDFAVGAGTDLAGVAQALSGMASVPLLRYQAIDAAIAQARADVQSIEAIRRQTREDLAARVVTDLSTIRDTDRQLKLIDQTISPRARQIIVLSRAGYEAGQSSLSDLLNSQRSGLDLDRLVSQLNVLQQKSVSDLEAIIGMPLITR